MSSIPQKKETDGVKAIKKTDLEKLLQRRKVNIEDFVKDRLLATEYNAPLESCFDMEKYILSDNIKTLFAKYYFEQKEKEKKQKAAVVEQIKAEAVEEEKKEAPVEMSS